MYVYIGIDQIIGKENRKEFEDESEALEYAYNHSTVYPDYKIIDLEENEIIASSELDKIEKDAIMDDMFPEGDEGDGFDVDDFLGSN